MTDATTESATGIEIDDLPSWMRPRRRAFDWAALIVLGFALLAASPLILGNGLPRDAEPFVIRSAQVARLVRQGVIYPRWLPDAHFTYGSPLLNYLAPLPHLLPGYHQAVTQTSAADSVRLFMILSMLAAGGGMYLFARRRWGAASGLVAALAYQFSGPLILNLPRLRGDLALLMALGLLPWAAWALDLIWQQPGRRAFSLAAFALGLFMLADARLAFLGGMALALVALTARRLPGADRRGGRWLLGAVLAALAVTAFFWIPALLELPAVRWLPADPTRLTGMIPLSESLSLSVTLDPAMLNAPDFRGIGPGLLILSVMGAAAILIRAVQQRAQVHDLVFLIFGLALLLLTTPTFARLWPDPRIFQAMQPYHVLLVAVFCLALVAGRAALWLEWLRTDSARVVFCALLVMVAPVAALPSLRPLPWDDTHPAADTLAVLGSEMQAEQAGSLREGLLLPTNAPDLPEAPPNLLTALGSDVWLPVNRQSISGPSQVDVLSQYGLTWIFILNMVQPSPIEFYFLNFPGWQAALDEQPLALQSGTTGAIQAELPAVNRTMTVWFGNTRTRDLAEWVSLITLAVLLLTLRGAAPGSDSGVLQRLSRGQLVAYALALLTCAAGLWLTSQGSSDAIRLARGQLASAATVIPRFLQGGVDLLAYDLPADSVTPGGELRLSIYWQASRPITEMYQSEAWLFDPTTRQTLARVAHRHPGGLPTLRWPLDRYVKDDFVLRLAPSVPPGDYVLRVAVGPCATRSILPCEQITALDAFTNFGEVERGGVTIPIVIRVR